MTVDQALVSFALVAGLVTITPGLDTAIVLRSTLRGGRRAGLLTALGVNAGVLCWGVAAALGVSALLAAAALAYDVLRYVGAAYLTWLGARLLWSATRGDQQRPAVPEQPAGHPADPEPGPPPAGWASLRIGLLTNLGAARARAALSASPTAPTTCWPATCSPRPR